MIKGSSTGGSSVGLKGGGRKRGILFLVSVLLIVQLITWRGTSKLKAVSLSKRSEYETRLNKRQFIDDTNQYNQSEIDWENGDSLMNKHKKDKKKSDKKHEKDDKKSNKKHEKKKKKEKDDKDHSSSSSTTVASQTSTFTSTSSESSTRTSMIECQPLPTHAPAQDVCEHVRQYCPPTGHLNYLEFFFCIGLSESSDIQTAKAQITAAPLPSPQPSEHDEEKDTYTKTERGGLDIRLKWLRAIALTCIIGWMLFLFSWVGIVASDFFCPNLSNLAARLGLSESTAGVTFLAFGNGSPDVFSTFGAMRSGSGSLAIGELIGAASFIVSVISGSMMLIAPFRVKPYPFIRDVGFFTVAVSLTMAYLIDGKLRFAECLSMIALYVAYAATIIIGSWWQERRSQNRARMASIRSENSFVHHSSEGGFREEIGRQTPSTQPHRSPRLVSAIEYEPDVDPFVQWATQQDTIANGGGHLTPPSVVSAGHSPLLQPTDLPTGSSGASTSNPRLLRFRAGVLARHSLLGAVEFRDVVRSLRQESGGGGVDHSMEIYQSRDPERYLPHPHSQSQIQNLNLDEDQRRSHKRAKSLTKPRINATNSDFHASMVRSRSTIGSSADHGPMTDIVRPTLEQVGQQAGLAAVAAAVGDPWKEHGPADGCDDPGLPLSSGMPTTNDLERGNGDVDHRSRPTLPRLAIRQATGSSRNTRLVSMDSNQTTSSYQSPFTSKDAFIRAIQRTRRALFPSLRHFREKSWLGIVVGLLTAPAILLLKLTLPVVDDEEEQSVITGEKRVRNGTTATNSNQIRLAGDESPLLARQPSYTARSLPTNPQYEDEEEEEEEEDDEDVEQRGRGIINLNSENIENPWDVSRAQSEENEEESNEESNRKRQLHVSSILRNLPEESSPLLFTSPRNMNTSSRSLNESEQSWQSDDSHSVSSSQSLFLTVAQCLFAPPFCVWAISSSAESEDVKINTILAFGWGLGIATMVFIMAMRIRHTGTQHRISPAMLTLLAWIRVAVGFFVSILYIMTIVDEVVSILQTLGLILGLSDAILGLTVFAMGNSLGDLVANITIAKMGHPVMAISACFAGPLLNLLLGIGISGSWLLSKGVQTIPEHPNQDLSMILFKKHHHHVNEEPGIYHIDFSPTLTVSGFGLLLILIGTLILVPLNGFYLDRRIGSTLIITYIIIMFVNIGVELYTLHRNV